MTQLITMQAASTAAPAAAGRETASTRRLLRAGVVAGPLYLGVAFAQAFTRDGFDPRRHPLSLLSTGDLGWIQMASFVLSGLLYLACRGRPAPGPARHADAAAPGIS